MIPSTEKFINEYYNPSGLTIIQFARKLNIERGRLNRVLNGRPMTMIFIDRLTKTTLTSVRSWIYLQTDSLFDRYVKRRVTPAYDRIKTNYIFRDENVPHPGFILLSEFIKPSGMTVQQVAKRCNLVEGNFGRIVHGRLQITHKTASVLGKVFRTGSKYWLDLQSKFDLFRIVKNDPLLSKQIINLNYEFSTSTSIVRPKLHPGLVLLNSYLKPSGISINDWAAFFCVRRNIFNSIIKGKSILPYELIIKISKNFETRIGFWVDMQNHFYAELMDKNNVNASKLVLPQIYERSQKSFLEEVIVKMLRSMNLKRSDLARHIGLSRTQFYNFLAGHSLIDFEMSIRLGEALGVDPRYWNWLQIERKIERYEHRKKHDPDDVLYYKKQIK